MPAVNTSSHLHRALGLPASPIDLSLIDQAIAASVAEADDLDWKAKLPDFKVTAAAQEFAKDVAAMANSSGGYVVYGVSEKDGRAATRTDVDVSERVQQRMLQAAHTHIRPFVPGITFIPLEAAAVNFGVLVMRVPASRDAPHQVGSDGTGNVGFPYRNGAHTAFYREHELARAYGDRFVRRDSDRQLVETLRRSTRRLVTARERTWAVVIAIPLSRAVVSINPIERSAVNAIIETAAASSVALVPPGSDERFDFLSDLSFVSGAELHRRAERWVIDSGVTGAYGVNIRAELHDNGAIVFAIDQGRGTPDGDPSNWMPIWRIESLVVDALSLVDTTASARGIDGAWLVALDLFPRADGEPFSLVDFHRWPTERGHGDGGHTIRIRGSRDLEGDFEAVDGEIRTPASPEEIFDVAQTLTLAAVNQFAHEKLQLLTPAKSADGE
jgi:hypothetical protein